VSVRIVLVDRDPAGLAEMLAALLESNLARDPGRAHLVAPGVVALEAVDAEVSVTVRTAPGVIEIAYGASASGVDIGIRASSGDLLEITAAPLRLGVPDPLRAEGRSVLRRVATGRVRISGMLRHPVRLSRFARLLSAR
jgi:hypothetical protein